MESWFEVHAGESNCVSLEFHRCGDGADWPVRVMSDLPLPEDFCRGRTLVLSGRAAVWMYAHAAARAAGGGASKVAVQAAQSDPVVISPQGACGAAALPRWLTCVRCGDRLRLEFLDPPGRGKWPPSILSELAGMPKDFRGVVNGRPRSTAQQVVSATSGGLVAGRTYAVAARAITGLGEAMATWMPLMSASWPEVWLSPRSRAAWSDRLSP